MDDRFFLDTNVLVYAVESTGPGAAKGAAAAALTGRPGATISTQVLGEFYNAATAKRRTTPLTHDEAVAWIAVWKAMNVEDIVVPSVDLALDIADRYGIGYYDGLIVAAASRSGCATLYSEDLNDGQTYHGVLVTNPFRGLP